MKYSVSQIKMPSLKSRLILVPEHVREMYTVKIKFPVRSVSREQISAYVEWLLEIGSHITGSGRPEQKGNFWSIEMTADAQIWAKILKNRPNHAYELELEEEFELDGSSSDEFINFGTGRSTGKFPTIESSNDNSSQCDDCKYEMGDSTCEFIKEREEGEKSNAEHSDIREEETCKETNEKNSCKSKIHGKEIMEEQV